MGDIRIHQYDLVCMVNFFVYSLPLETRIAHSVGGQTIRWSLSHDHLFATTGRPGSTLKVFNLKTNQVWSLQNRKRTEWAMCELYIELQLLNNCFSTISLWQLTVLGFCCYISFGWLIDRAIDWLFHSSI